MRKHHACALIFFLWRFPTLHSKSSQTPNSFVSSPRLCARADGSRCLHRPTSRGSDRVGFPFSPNCDISLSFPLNSHKTHTHTHTHHTHVLLFFFCLCERLQACISIQLRAQHRAIGRFFHSPELLFASVLLVLLPVSLFSLVNASYLCLSGIVRLTLCFIFFVHGSITRQFLACLQH